MVRQRVFKGWFPLVVVLSWLCFAPSSAQPQQEFPGSAPPETILGTFHVIKGHDQDMKKLIDQAWSTYRKLDYVFPQPHVVLQGVEGGDEPYFVEIFTWKSADYPDHAPAEIQAIWKQMQQICEKRNGKPGIEGSSMKLLIPAQQE